MIPIHIDPIPADLLFKTHLLISLVSTSPFLTSTFRFHHTTKRCKGKIHTTFGTDFNCVAQSILDRSFDKAVIITDGYASMSEELKQGLAKQRLVTLTILFDDAQTCEDFAQFGEVLQLDDIVA